MLLVLVIVLVVTNLATLGVVLYLRLRADAEIVEDPEIAAALAALSASPSTAGHPRRFISVEILNPIELAGTRGRVLGIAGSFAPGLTRRIVHDQVVKEMRRLFAAQRVVADVHVHSIHPTPVTPSTPTAPAPAPTPPPAVIAPAPAAPAPEPHTVEIAPGVLDDIDALTNELAEDQRPL